MRNLKRVLSLALALVMVLGMMVIGTSAATFTDAEEITYTEAVEVANAIGVINGYPAADGTFYFDGDGVLTREQGAALICYLLMGKTAADKLVGSGNFTDVASDRWSAGEIDYCVSLGYIAGNGDGTFSPEAPLTGLAYGKLLLAALGYDAKVEGYVNNENWATNIAVDMMDAGLTNDAIALDAQLTREAAAQMTLQALTATMVKYTTKGTSITVGGVEIVSGASEATAVVRAENGVDEPTNYYGTTAGVGTLQFCEKYFSKLTKAPVAAAANGGLAGYQWKLTTDALPFGVYATESVKASYAAGTKLVDIVKALGVQDTTSTAVTEYDVEVYRNGVWTKGVYSVDAADTFVDLTNVSGAALYDYAEAFGTIPNGCSIDVVVTKDAGKQPVIRLLTNISYLATIGKSDVTKDEVVDDEDTRAVTITASNGIEYTLTAKNCETFEEIFAAASALKKPTDKLSYVIVPEGDPAAQDEAGLLLSIAAPTAVTGTMTSYNAVKGTYVVDGKTYKVNATGSISVNTLIGEEAVYLLDANGFILTATPVVEVADAVYAYLRDLAYVTIADDGSIGSRDTAYLQAELIFTDGTRELVTVAALTDDALTTYVVGTVAGKKLDVLTVDAEEWDEDAADFDADDGAFRTGFIGEFVSYEVDEDGYYYLASAANSSAADRTDLKADVVFSANYAANTKTTFVVETTNPVTRKPVYTAYTGYANLPAKAIAKADIVAMTDKGVTTVVYVYVETAADGSSADNKTVAYITGDPTFFYVDGKTKDYYEYTAVINGAATTLKVAADDVVAKGNLYTIKTLDKNGYVSDADVIAMTDYVSVAAANEIVKIGTNWKSYDENTVVYAIDKFGAVKTVDITALEAGQHALYVTYVKDKANPANNTNVIATIVAVESKAVPAVTSVTWNLEAAEGNKYYVRTTFTNATYLPAGATKIVLKDAEGEVIATATSIANHTVAANATLDCPFWGAEHESDNWTDGHQDLGETVLTAASVEVYLFGKLVKTVEVSFES